MPDATGSLPPMLASLYHGDPAGAGVEVIGARRPIELAQAPDEPVRLAGAGYDVEAPGPATHFVVLTPAGVPLFDWRLAQAVDTGDRVTVAAGLAMPLPVVA